MRLLSSYSVDGKYNGVIEGFGRFLVHSLNPMCAPTGSDIGLHIPQKDFERLATPRTKSYAQSQARPRLDDGLQRKP